jgi:hypothetical protein
VAPNGTILVPGCRDTDSTCSTYKQRESCLQNPGVGDMTCAAPRKAILSGVRDGMASRYCVRRLHAVEVPSHLRGVRAAHGHRGPRGGEQGILVTTRTQTLWTASGRNCASLPRQRLQVYISENVSMPLIGFGTAGLGNQTQKAVQIALASGYRLIDSAQVRMAFPALALRSRASRHVILV